MRKEQKILKDIVELYMHESINIDGRMEAMRVPGGLIYIDTTPEFSSMVFVPFIHFAPMENDAPHASKK